MTQRSSQTQVEYRLSWARTYLKKYGILENSSRGVWALTSAGSQLETVNPQEVKRFVGQKKSEIQVSDTAEDVPEMLPTWRDDVMDCLLNMQPQEFERFIQRLLRESGFVQVEVTGRSGDGGIDGKGIIRLGGLMSFYVHFQCKHYKGTVTPEKVRDFRGTMVGRADKGLLVTTGYFTKDAIKEATRDGAPPIYLIDGEQLIDKLKELSLGIQIKKIESEEITVDTHWFANI
jgi:restriction system protein